VSSPIVDIAPNYFQRNFVHLHQKIAHLNRVHKLASMIGIKIQGLFPHKNAEIQGLDVGCGDMQLVETISANNPAIKWTCTDIHELPENLKNSEKWSKYIRFDGNHLPFPDNSFDVVVFSDVLHHCMPNAAELLMEAKRVGKYVIVKDHFEHGFISRNILKMMDVFGNYGYGVPIPRRYFTKQAFVSLVDKSQSHILSMEDRLNIYPAILSLILRPKFQFLAVLSSKTV
jgi:SAM-dependent methyltransferase